ncbi:MAG: FeoB-associated Cys-rich membrane protein [Deltaproteobacteria bacterium]|nr:FeoB-associated Cys-rich membrane protein [Deltaproteobacteria bacterium]
MSTFWQAAVVAVVVAVAAWYVIRTLRAGARGESCCSGCSSGECPMAGKLDSKPRESCPAKEKRPRVESEKD